MQEDPPPVAFADAPGGHYNVARGQQQDRNSQGRIPPAVLSERVRPRLPVAPDAQPQSPGGADLE